jgi:hypothetical protein
MRRGLSVLSLSLADKTLVTRYPAVAAQWHPTRNGNVTPDAVVSGYWLFGCGFFLFVSKARVSM